MYIRKLNWRQTQFEQWIQNIWDREDKASATSHNTELVTTVPEDILSVVKSHFDIAKEHIPENTLAKLMEVTHIASGRLILIFL